MKKYIVICVLTFCFCFFTDAKTHKSKKSASGSSAPVNISPEGQLSQFLNQAGCQNTSAAFSFLKNLKGQKASFDAEVSRLHMLSNVAISSASSSYIRSMRYDVKSIQSALNELTELGLVNLPVAYQNDLKKEPQLTYDQFLSEVLAGKRAGKRGLFYAKPLDKINSQVAVIEKAAKDLGVDCSKKQKHFTFGNEGKSAYWVNATDTSLQATNVFGKQSKDKSTAVISVTLPEDRCKPGKISGPWGSCEVLGRGETLLEAPSPSILNRYSQGVRSDKKPCWFLKEGYQHGATPIPSQGHYYLEFMPRSGGKDHWYDVKETQGNNYCWIVNGKKYCADKSKPIQMFRMLLYDKSDAYYQPKKGEVVNSIPRGRDIGTLRLHQHGFDALYGNIETEGTWGCLKVAPDCLDKMTNWSAKSGNPRVKMEIKRSGEKLL